MLIVYTSDCLKTMWMPFNTASVLFEIDQEKLEATSLEWEAAEDLPDEFLLMNKGAYVGRLMTIWSRDEFCTFYSDKFEDIGVRISHPREKKRRKS